MARSNSVLLYGMRGRLGDVVLCYSKGCTYIRRCPQKSTKPLTDTQITQRKRFAACVLFFRSVEAVGLKPAWQAAARGKRWSAFNLFIKVNLHNFTSEGHILDFEQLLLTPEKRSAPPHLHVVHREDGCVDVDWYAEEAPWRGRGSDRLRAVVMGGEDSYVIRIADTGDARRADCCARVRLPEAEQKWQHLFLYFESEDGSEFSMTKHFIF